MNTVPRLITYFIPNHYNLSLRFDRPARTFEGTVTIEGTATSTESIRLHAKELVIKSVVYDGKAATFSTGENDELTISHDDHRAGSHIITVTYSGTITDAMHGLYPCYYEHNGEKKELLATQFESHHAREVFPCIDEPQAKATFDVTLSTEPGVSVLGNMPIQHQAVENDRLVTTFERTPTMSSYLVAWVIGDLQSISKKTKRGVDVAIWATPAQTKESLDFALDIAVRSIEFYEDYFQTEYPLPKSDHVALPDFSSGAMENWGLITYREMALLADPKTTGISSRQYIATVIAHELAHQWFGNLVTMKWWNDLWLNESFATLMEYIAVDALEPEWNMWLEFSTNENILALRRDSIDGVQPVQIDVNHPDEINTLFDGAIVYAKGARLLRMLQHYVGDKDFQTALKHYFSEHAFKNTEANDLWKAIETTSGKDISEFMSTWLSQPGYPVVRVMRDGQTIILSQEQFFVGPHQPSTRIWPIPLDSNADSIPELLTKATMSFDSDASPLRLNQDDSAHFITHYDNETFAQLLKQASNLSLSPLSRLQLLHETTLLARSGLLATAQLLPAIKAYKNEPSEPVWGILFIALSELRKFVESNEKAEKRLRQLSAQVAATEYGRLGWQPRPGESEDDTKLRATILSLVLYGELPDAIEQAQSIYATNALDEIEPEIRPLIISTVARYGDGKVVDDLMSAYTSTASSDLQMDIAIGVTSTREPDTIHRLLASIKDNTIIRPQDAARWFVYLIRGKESRTPAWLWLRDNWDWIEATFGGDKSYDDYPRYAASALSTREQLQEYSVFFTPKIEIPALSRAITMGISEIEGRVELIERDGPAVIQALLSEKD